MELAFLAIVSIAPLMLAIVGIHEFGHFITARAYGIKVLEFGIGFPPAVFKLYTGRTKVGLRSKTVLFYDGTAATVAAAGERLLRSGQLVRVGSLEDPSAGLVAFEMEIKDKHWEKKKLSHFGARVDGVLWHEGKIRSVGPQSFELADMAYSINAFPIGGFVKVAGEDDPTVPMGAASKHPFKRIVVLVAGVFMNFVLATTLIAILFMVPREMEQGRLMVSDVDGGSGASAAGIQPGDVILSIQGQPVHTGPMLTRAVALANVGDGIESVIERDGLESVVTINPEYRADEDRWVIGVITEMVDVRTVERQFSPWNAAAQTFIVYKEAAVIVKNLVGGMIDNKDAPTLAGPVGVTHAIGEAVQKYGVIGLVFFIIIISINVAIFNILPIPPLDGGHILFALIEWARGGRRVSLAKQQAVSIIAVIMLLGFALYVTTSDVERLAAGGSLIGELEGS